MPYLQGYTARTNRDASDRQERQMQLNNLIKGFELNQESGQYEANERGRNAMAVQSEKVNQELMYLREQNKLIGATLNEKSMTEGVTEMVKGNIADGWETIKRNKPLADTLRAKGVHSVAPVDWVNDKEMYEKVGINVPTEVLQDPITMKALNSAFMKVQGADGTWKLAETANLAKSTGTMQYMKSADRQGMAERFNRIHDIIKGYIPTPLEEEYGKTSLRAGIAQNSLNELKSSIDINALAEWATLNPNKTVDDYIAEHKQTVIDPTKQAEIDDLYIDKAISDNEKVIVDSLPTIKPKEYTSEMYSVVKRLEASNKKLGLTAQPAEIKQVRGYVNSTRKFKKLAEDIKHIDRDAFTKARNELLSIKGLSTSLSGTAQEKAKQLADRVASLTFKTELGVAMKEYVKLMSGATVTDKEFGDYMKMVVGGEYSDGSVASVALDSFASSLESGLMNSLEGIRTTNPWFYMNTKSAYDKSISTLGSRSKGKQADKKPLSGFKG